MFVRNLYQSAAYFLPALSNYFLNAWLPNLQMPDLLFLDILNDFTSAGFLGLVLRDSLTAGLGEKVIAVFLVGVGRVFRDFPCRGARMKLKCSNGMARRS